MGLKYRLQSTRISFHFCSRSTAENLLWILPFSVDYTWTTQNSTVVDNLAVHFVSSNLDKMQDVFFSSGFRTGKR